MKPVFCSFAAFLLTVSTAAWAQPTSQPGWDEEIYMAAYLNDQRIGYAALRQRTNPDGVIETFIGFKLSLKSAMVAMNVTTTEIKRESADGTPLSFSEYQSLAASPVRREGVIRNGKLEVTSQVLGRRFSTTRPWDDRIRFDAAHERKIRAELKADGDTITFFDYDSSVSDGGLVEATVERIGFEQIRVGGQRVRGLHLRTSSPQMPCPEELWVDESFDPLAVEMSLNGNTMMRLERCTKEFAHRGFVAPELLANSLIQLDRPLDEPHKISSLRLTLDFSDPLDKPLAPPIGARQQVLESTRHRLVMQLHRPDYPPPSAENLPIPDDVVPFLSPGETIDSTDPAIRKAADEAVASAPDSLAAAKALRDWVDSHVTFKDLSVGSATASEVLRARRGDCTEHSVLLVAMARAAGIPARTVCGLVYVDRFVGRKAVLGLHQWAQLYIRGQWIDFDSPIPGDPAIAARLAMYYGAADGKINPADLKQVFGLFGTVRKASADQIKRSGEENQKRLTPSSQGTPSSQEHQ